MGRKYYSSCAYIYTNRRMTNSINLTQNQFEKGITGEGEAMGSNQKHLYSLDIFQLGCGSPADQSKDNPRVGWCGC